MAPLLGGGRSILLSYGCMNSKNYKPLHLVLSICTDDTFRTEKFVKDGKDSSPAEKKLSGEKLWQTKACFLYSCSVSCRQMVLTCR